MSKPLPIGTKVVDRDGFKGTIRNITYHSGSFWYDVALPGGMAVRFADDLTVEGERPAPAAMYVIRLKDGRRWKVREAISLEAACQAITSARVMGSIGQKNVIDETHTGGSITVQADVIQINSDGSERRPYTEAY